MPLLQPARYKGAYGGRGSAKSHFFADRLIKDCVKHRSTAAACIREVQRTLGQSSKRLIESKLHERGWASGRGFKIFKDVIETPGDGIISFIGLQDHTADSIKSLEGYRRFWVDEAQQLGAYSLKILRPTPRAEGAEMWFSWNPKNAPDPEHPDASIDGMFRLNNPAELPGGGICIQANWRDNPWLPDDLYAELCYDFKHRIKEDYQHIWEGAYQTRSEARVFHNWEVRDFDTPTSGVIFRFGADFGFAQDPSVLVRAWIGRFDDAGNAVHDPTGRDLFLDFEAYKVGCDVDYTPALFAGGAVAGEGNPWGNKNPFSAPGIPEAHRFPITCDSANPQTISYLQRHGLPGCKPAIKGPGSIEEGVEFLKSYRVIIHPRCRHTADEFLLYSYKTDPKTEQILPILEDKKNHVIDAVRYALEDVRRGRGFFG